MPSIAPPAAAMAQAQVLGVQDPDDILGLASVQRQARVVGFQGLGDHLRHRQVGVDHIDRFAMDHDLRDVDLRQVQHPAQHVPVPSLHRPFRVVVVDRAADFLVGRQDVRPHVQLDAERPQGLAHDPLDGADHGSQNPHHQQHRPREGAGHIVGADDGDGLGRHTATNTTTSTVITPVARATP